MGVLHFDIHVYICSYVAMYELGSAYMYHERSFHAGFESNPGYEVHTCSVVHPLRSSHRILYM